jgi:hypothetical protein
MPPTIAAASTTLTKPPLWPATPRRCRPRGAIDPKKPLAYLSYCAGGVRVLEYGNNGLTEVAALAGLSPGASARLPVRLEVVASAEPLDVFGDEILDPLQVFLVGSFGA